MVTIELVEYNEFMRVWRAVYAGQRLGQAMVNHWRLDRMADQSAIGDLYELDGTAATDRFRSFAVFS